ncbi:carbonic anhydrase 4 [Pseudophryne corroboree]|uniref:carbonic anhydrase 4 n=1 Tax=Pseudophryne corroboree TaxID=495146 RepID=UPI003081A179
MSFSYLYFVFTLHVITLASDTDWCYDIQKSINNPCTVPRQWKEVETLCGGTNQSPINIVTKNAHYEPNLTPFSFNGYNNAKDCPFKNNGHSVELELPENEMTISGGGLTGTYMATQLHFHWGSVDMDGSEHSIDGERYPIELHIVHTKKSDKSESGGSAADSTSESGAIAVLGFFLEASPEHNSKYDGLISGLSHISGKGNTTTVVGVKLQDLIPDKENLMLYYRYEGSLTTPSCNETVTWTVFNNTIKLAPDQIKEFYQKIKYPSGGAMAENFRPTQKLGSRNVFTSGVEAVLPHSRHLLISLIAVYAVSAS